MNGFIDFGVVNIDFCIEVWVVLLIGFNCRGVFLGLFFSGGVILLLGFFFKGFFVDFKFVIIVELLVFDIDNVCVCR